MSSFTRSVRPVPQPIPAPAPGNYPVPLRMRLCSTKPHVWLPSLCRAHLRPVCFWSVLWLILSFGKDKMYCSLFTRPQADGHLSRLWGLVIMMKAAMSTAHMLCCCSCLCCSPVTPPPLVPEWGGSACSEAAKPSGKMAATDFAITTLGTTTVAVGPHQQYCL